MVSQDQVSTPILNRNTHNRQGLIKHIVNHSHSIQPNLMDSRSHNIRLNLMGNHNIRLNLTGNHNTQPSPMDNRATHSLRWYYAALHAWQWLLWVHQTV
jgi:hypothetical protein